MTQRDPSDPRTVPSVAVVGTGRWGRNIVRNFAELGALAMVVDPNVDAARPLAEKYGAKVGQFADALADPTVNGIVIAAPATLHSTLAKQALEAGKHVFVEKPLALNLADAERGGATSPRSATGG